MKFKRLVVTLIMSALSTSLMAIEESQIAHVMKERIDTVTEVLQKNTLSKDERNRKIFAIFDPVFDYKLISRLSLGKRQWLSLTQKNREQFAKQFEKKLKDSFIDKLELYSDEKVVIKEAKKVKKNRIQLLTELEGKETTYEITYKFYNSRQNGWMIYDVDILGVSLVQTYRVQFAGILKKESFESLLQKIDSVEVKTPKK